MINDYNNITLIDWNDNPVEFELLDIIFYENEKYVVLFPVDEDENKEGEVTILKVEDLEEEEESYVSVNDQKILDVIFDLFKNKTVI